MFKFILLIFVLLFYTQSIYAQTFYVKNVQSDDTLSIREKPDYKSKKVGELAYNASNIRPNSYVKVIGQSIQKERIKVHMIRVPSIKLVGYSAHKILVSTYHYIYLNYV